MGNILKKKTKYCQTNNCYNEWDSFESNYCKEHTCKTNKCYNGVIDGYSLCVLHKCTIYNCKFGTYINGMCAACFLRFAK